MASKTRTVAGTGGIALALFFAWLGGEGSAARAQATLVQVPLPEAAYDAPIFGTVTGHRSSVWDHFFRFPVNSRGVTRHSWERENSSDPWEKVSQEYSAAYRISAIGTSDGGHTIYVAGFSDAGEGLIERWSFPKRAGGWAVDIPPLSSAAPVATTPPLTRAITGGGPWVTPTTHPGRLVPTREVLYSSPGRYFMDVAVDPNQRYLICYDAVGEELLQIDLTLPQSTGSVLLSAGSVDPFLEQVELVELRDYIPEAPNGRKLLVQSKMTLEGDIVQLVRLLLSDPENDGTFDLSSPPVILVGDFSWKQSDYATATDWDRFVFAP